MEKIPAACAMGWSIDLEKGLRSKRPGCPVESIHKIGSRLKHWSTEPRLTMPVYNMLGLVPGEDRLFADAILLRLADAFVAGDNVTRIAIIKVFLSTHRHCKRKDAQECLLFLKMNMDIRLELLRRVKVLLRAECIESRALAVILFGCWADIAKDVAEIKHAILSSLVSCHVLEVKASLFAAGCFSEVSDDFASVFLERLLNLMNSPNSSAVLKVAGARAFTKINYSVLLAVKAYQAGAELVKKLSEEDILTSLLISLTNLSSKAGILVSEQVCLLCSFLTQDASLHMQATILRSMLCLAERVPCFLASSTIAFHTLFTMFDELNLPSPLRCDVLRIFLKIIAYGIPDEHFTDVNKLMKLLRYFENATQSSFLPERLLAFELLVHISNKLKGKPELMSDGSSSDPVASGIVVALSGQIARLTSQVSDITKSSESERELKSIFKLLLLLVENHSELGYCILDKLHNIINNTANSHNMPGASVQNSQPHEVVNVRAEENSLSVRRFMFHLHRFLISFLEILDEADATTDKVVCKLKNLVAFVCGNGSFDCSIHTFYALILRLSGKCSSLFGEEKNTGDSEHGISKTFIHECLGNMLAGGDNWYAYRAGKFAVSKGDYYVANMIFQNLKTKVQSQILWHWLEFLVQFTHVEKNAQMLIQQAGLSWPLEDDHMDRISSEYIEKFLGVGEALSSSGKVLEAISAQTQTFYFQRWFLALRVKVLLVLADMLKLLDNIRKPGGSDVHDINLVFQEIKGNDGITLKLTRISEECDLMASSFIDMDSKSLTVLSSLAFCCSLLAFFVEFTILRCDSLFFQNRAEKFRTSWYVLVHDLAKRLSYTDSEAGMNLMSLLKGYGLDESSLHLLPRFHLIKVGHVPQTVLGVCRRSVKKMAQFSKDTKSPVFKEMKILLLQILAECMRTPFQIPKYFFRVRPSMGAMLFASNASGRRQSILHVFPGSHLSLNLCIQLKNLPSNICSFSKICCILYCQNSLSSSKTMASCGETQETGYQPSKTEMLIDLNKKLQSYMLKETQHLTYFQNLQSDDGIEAYVCFESKGRTQGFSTCLLDVSGFPVGSYRIHWHSGFVDSSGTFWSLLPLSRGPVFTVGESLSYR